MDELIYGINIEEIERITGEDQQVIKKWKKELGQFQNYHSDF